MLIILLFVLGLAILVYATALARAAYRQRSRPDIEALGLGAIVNFFDTLGIGSFATTAAWLNFRKLVPDRLIPPTMVVGLTPPAMAQSIIFLILLGVEVDPLLLAGCAIATMVGGIVGAPLVARAKVWVVQLTVGIGLALAATAYLMTNLHLFPGGGSASGLPIGPTLVAIAASFGFGVLANFGVGNYAPTLVMLSLMGMDPRLCFPIMATGGSLMGAGASVRHFAICEVNLKIVLGLAIGGIPAVLVAALLVKSMPVDLLRWLVLVVVVYASAVMFRSAIRGRREGRVAPEVSTAATS
ncbi:MAG: hypothetical protein ABIU10_04165 [Sphingomicrobium sp.]